MLNRLRQYFERELQAQDGHQEQQLQLATAALLLEMARSDNEVDARELATIKQEIKRRFHLDPQQTQALLALAETEVAELTSYHPITQLIKNEFNDQEKSHIIELLWMVAFSDGKLDKHEEHLLRKIANLIYVSRADIVAAKHRAQAAIKQQTHDDTNTEEPV